MGGAVGTVTATDPDADDVIKYALSGSGATRFAVADNGAITYAGEGEDYETGPKKYTLTLTAEDKAKLKGTTTVTVNITNVEEPPKFERDSYSFNLPENQTGPYDVGKAVATHSDGLDFTYSLSGAGATNFSIDTAGNIRYTGPGEDYEQEPRSYSFKAVATDTKDRKGEADVTVTIQDESEGPLFAQSQYDFELEENVSGTENWILIGKVSATDPEGEDIGYALKGDDADLFVLSNFLPGNVYYAGPGEDFEAGPETYDFIGVATDPDGLEGETRIVVTIKDVNEAPTFVAEAFTFELEENMQGPVDLGIAAANDPDEGDQLAFKLDGAGSTKFSISEQGQVTYTGVGEDFETDPGPFTFMAVVEDSEGLNASANITVDVKNQNEAPVFDTAEYEFSLSENRAGPVALGMTKADDPDGDELRFELSGDAGKFSVDVTSGEVRYIGSGEDYENGPASYDFEVHAKDDGDLSGSADVTVTILDANEAPMVVSPIPDIVAQVGTSHDVDVIDVFIDPDGDALTYSATSSATNIVEVSIAGSQLQVRGLSIGSAIVAVIATDPDGLSGEIQVSVQVKPSVEERARTLQVTLAAMARAIGTETVDVIGTRMDAARTEEHIRVMGHSLSCGWLGGGSDCSLGSFAQTAVGVLGLRAPRSSGLRSMPGAAMQGRYASAGGAGLGGLSQGYGLSQSSLLASKGSFTLWAQGSVGGFEGVPEPGISYDGGTTSLYLGADYQLHAKVMGGLAMSLTAGAIDYDNVLNGEGTVDVSMIGFHPYMRYSPRTGLDFWGVFGGGTGSAEVSEDLAAGFDTDLSMILAVLGVRQQLKGGFALKADMFSVSINSAESGEEIGQVEAGSQRLRLAPEFGINRSNATASYSGHIEFGLRIDGGDVENGFGAEAGFSGGYAHAPTGLSFDLRARTLLVHQSDDYTDWGASVAVRLTPGGDEGLALAIEPGWGNARGGAIMRNDGTLDQMMPFVRSTTGTFRPDHVGVQVGYGMAVGAKTRMAPFGRWTNSAASGYQIQAGTRVAVLEKQDGKRPAISLDVFGEQHVSGSVMGNARVGLRGIVKLD